jgi:hypothetical protein
MPSCRTDWDCEVKMLFRDTNVGCKIGPSSAIDWFFEHGESGIILEDDCVPHPTFFITALNYWSTTVMMNASWLLAVTIFNRANNAHTIVITFHAIPISGDGLLG